MVVVTEKTIRRVPAPYLSKLIVDVDKDWGGYKIKNLGAPVDTGDAVRKIDLDTHRTSSPIDHPDASVTTAKISSGAVTPSRIGVSLAEGINATNWFIATGLDIIHHENPVVDHTVTLLNRTLSDYSAIYISRDNMRMWHRNRYPTWGSGYTHEMATANTTQDHLFVRWYGGSPTILGYEAVDLSDYHYLYGIDISGSSFKCYRAWVTAKTISSATPKFTVTDTRYASGYIGIGFVGGYYPIPYAVPTWFSAFSRGVEAVAIIEMNVEGSGRPEDPYRPSFSSQLVDITSLQNLPDFLYRDAKRYQMLNKRNFTDEEIELLLGYIPQTKVDLDTLTWGAFELHPDKSPTVIVTITGDNPYSPGGVERQKTRAKQAFTPPKSYDKAVALYNQLKRDYPHWLAGKDNFAYQVLGLEELDLFQNVDFYYGELLEHKVHYSQLKQVPDLEIRNRLNELIDRLSKVTILVDERDRHIAKAREVLRRGW